MGRVLKPALEEAGHELVELCRGRGDGRLHSAGRGGRQRHARLDAGVPCVVGTSGWDTDEVAAKAEEAGVAVFYAPNFAIGAVLMMRFAAEAAKHMPRAEIVELHHETKVDAPSGTAKATAEAMGGDVPIHSVRLPGHRRPPGGAPRGDRAAADDPPRRAFPGRPTFPASCSRSNSSRACHPG